MQNMILGVVFIVLAAIIGAVVGCVKKSGFVLGLYILGLVVLGFGVYLLPATMWRSIAIGCLIVGVALECIAIVITLKVKKGNSTN